MGKAHSLENQKTKKKGCLKVKMLGSGSFGEKKKKGLEREKRARV